MTDSYGRILGFLDGTVSMKAVKKIVTLKGSCHADMSLEPGAWKLKAEEQRD
jgi:hypothetical protein